MQKTPMNARTRCTKTKRTPINEMKILAFNTQSSEYPASESPASEPQASGMPNSLPDASDRSTAVDEPELDVPLKVPSSSSVEILSIAPAMPVWGPRYSR